MKTITGKDSEILKKEIEVLYKSFVDNKKQEIISEHSEKNDAFSRIIMIYLAKILSYQNEIEKNLEKFYYDLMCIKVLQLVYLTWKTGADTNSNIEYSYGDLKDIAVLPGVFSPRFATDSYLWAKYMVDSGVVKDKRVLEMGAGTGIISIYLYLYGKIKSIVAADINEQAINNLELNVDKLKINKEIFKIIRTDLYGSLGNEEKFDVIFWAYVWIKLEDEKARDIIQNEADQNVKRLLNSVTDSNYDMLYRFMRESWGHLSENGKLLLITSDFLPNHEIKQVAESIGYTFKIEKFTENSEVVKGANMVLDLYQIVLEKTSKGEH